MEVPFELIDSVTTQLNLSKFPPQQRAILNFALKASQHPKSISEGDFKALRDFGLSDGEIMEVVLTAAFTNFINMWADVSRIELDGEEQTR
jgi:alkylhydroperoxidase family enzyme